MSGKNWTYDNPTLGLIFNLKLLDAKDKPSVFWQLNIML